MKTYYGVALIKADEEAPDSDIKIPCLVFDGQEVQRTFMIESSDEALAFKKHMESEFPNAEYALATITFKQTGE